MDTRRASILPRRNAQISGEGFTELALVAESRFQSDFAEAAETFDDRHAFIQFDGKHSRNEERFLLVGRSYQGRLLMTVLTVRASLVRIISSRRASRREARGYEERV